MRSSTIRSRLSAVSWMHLPSGHTIMSGAWLQGNMHPVTVTRISVSRAWASLSFSRACRSAAPAALQRGPRHASRWCLKGGNSCQAGLRSGASDPVTARHSFDIVCPGRTAPAWTTTFGPSAWSRTHCPAYPAQPGQRHRPILATPTDEFDSGVIDRVKNINERRTGAL